MHTNTSSHLWSLLQSYKINELINMISHKIHNYRIKILHIILKYITIKLKFCISHTHKSTSVVPLGTFLINELINMLTLKYITIELKFCISHTHTHKYTSPHMWSLMQTSKISALNPTHSCNLSCSLYKTNG